MDRPQLQYAIRPPGHKNRRIRRGVIGTVAILAVVPLVWIAAPRAWNRARVLYWQHKAMRYAPAADQVVYDDDPLRYHKLLKSGEFYELTGPPGSHAAIRLAVPWYRFSEVANLPWDLQIDTLFLHERRNGKGEPRAIVIAGGWPRWPYDGHAQPGQRGSFEIVAAVVRPSSLYSNPATTGAVIINLDAGSYKETDRLKWFAGQPDPTDDSHFTIGYEINGIPQIVDGWLKNDDTLTIETRK